MKTQTPRLVADFISNVLPSMHGWCTGEKATALVANVVERRPSVCMEIGVYAGRSLISIALALHCNSHGRIIGIDPWTSEASVEGFEHDSDNRNWWNGVDHDFILNQCRYFMKSMGVESRVDLIRASSEQAFPCFRLVHELFAKGPFIDFLHIDGNHSELCALKDVENYVPLVVAGGTVVFDDINWQTTAKAQVKLLELCEHEYYVDAEGQKCGFFRKK